MLAFELAFSQRGRTILNITYEMCFAVFLSHIKLLQGIFLKATKLISTFPLKQASPVQFQEDESLTEMKLVEMGLKNPTNSSFRSLVYME